TAAPSTSPVTPARRAAMKPASPRAATMAAAATRSPATPSPSQARTRASARAIGAALARRPARNAAPWPSTLAGGKHRARRGGVATDEAVEAVRQAVEVEAAGQDLPRGHREERGEERGEEDTRHALDADQHEPNAEPDDREPDRRASERVHVVRRAPRQRHDR